MSCDIDLVGFSHVYTSFRNVAGPLAHIDGVSRPAGAISPPPSSPTPQSSPSLPGSTLPPLTQQDKTKFLKLFIRCGPVNGLLSGEFMVSALRLISGMDEIVSFKVKRRGMCS